jgi:hypothetical protein
MYALPFQPTESVRFINGNVSGVVDSVILFHGGYCEYNVSYWKDGERVSMVCNENELCSEDGAMERSVVVKKTRKKRND